ncbi:MAG: hypothetical protein JNM33_15110 [Rubrivivax sp.]|nr:hypothetical protein [Rubrivivax sp.]
MNRPHWTNAEAVQLAQGRDRAAYVCWLLRMDPWRVFPFGPEVGPEADEHFIEWTRTYVAGLIDNVRRAGPEAARAPEAVRYLLTLHHVDAVLSGEEDPAISGFQNALGFRRGELILPEPYKKKGAGK